MCPFFLSLALLGCQDPDPVRDRPAGTDDEPTVPDPTGTEPTEDPRVVVSGRIECPSPGERSAQPMERHLIGEDWAFDPQYPDPGRNYKIGAEGVVVDDFDGDDVLDLVVPRDSFDSLLLRGLGDGTFAEPEPLTGPVQDAFGASSADVDGDGDQDLLVTKRYTPAALLLNDGTGTFEGVGVEEEREHPGCGGSASWGDLDLDGDLDLFLGRLDFAEIIEDGNGDKSVWTSDCDSSLYVSQLLESGELTFTDASHMLSEDVQLDRSMSSGWHQLDDDPYPELYVVTDLPASTPGNRVLDNDGGVLEQVDDHPLNIKLAGMGQSVADLNGDGVLDLVVPGIEEIVVLQSGAGGLWIDHALAMGLVTDVSRDQRAAWGGEWADLDNDGLLDLTMGFGTLGSRTGVAVNPWQPDEIYLQVEPGTFAPTGEAWGVDDDFTTRGSVVADLDRNGFLDHVKREHGGMVTVDLGRCDDSSWLLVRLHDPTTANPRGVGATIRVRDDDDAVFLRTVTAGSTGYASGGPPEAHFGLGARERVAEIEVTWPSGEVVVYPGVQTRQIVDLWYELP